MDMSDEQRAGVVTGRKVGRPRIGKPYVLGQAGRDYLRWMETKGKKPRSIRSTGDRINSLQKFYGWEFDLRRLLREATPAQPNASLEEFVRERMKTVKPVTLNGELTTFAIIVKRAFKDEKLVKTPALESISEFKQKVGQDDPEALTDDELNLLIDVSRKIEGGEQAALAILIAAHVGFRHREICQLRRASVDFKANRIKVFSWNTKAHKGRTLALTQELASQLHIYLDKLEDKGPLAWLFPGAYNDRGRNNLFVEVGNAFKAAGLYDAKRKPGLHLLRKTWATNAVRAGVKMNLLRKLGGWASLQAVEPYFAVHEEERQEAADLMYPGLKSAPAPAEASGINAKELRELVAGGMSYEAALAYLEKRQ